MIRLLRFVSVTNAAVWFGAAIFYTLFVAPGLNSTEMRDLLQPKNFPFFGGEISQVVLARYFGLHLICASVAVVHTIAERLYFGRSSKRDWTGLMLALWLFGLLGSFWVGPKLRQLHRAQYFTNATPTQRETAAKSFRKWHAVFQVANVFVIAGIGAVLWRAVTPSNELRFVGSAKIRG